MPIFRGGGGRRPSGGGKKRPFTGGKKKSAGFKKKRPIKKKKKPMKKAPAPSIESTGMEAYYMKELMDSEALVTVVLNVGAPIRGYVRYYDMDVFSVGPADGSPKVFLRKENIRYILEDGEEEEEAEDGEEEEDDDDEEEEEDGEE